MRGLLLCGGWLLATSYLAGATGGCWQRCCPGRNNACWAPGTHRARCYCDSYCQRTGDCCEDYRAACRHAGECWVGRHRLDPVPWGWGHQPELLLLVVGFCLSLLTLCFEQ